jgi:tyrosinase
MGLRRNVKRLSEAERAKLIAGLQALKKSGKYDELSAICAAHVERSHHGPAYLPWHRALLLELERRLQSALHDSEFALPYWDFAADAALPDATRSFFWELFGGSGAPLETGPFSAKDWPIPAATAPAGGLARRLGEAQGASLPTRDALRAALALKTYDAPPWDATSEGSFRRALEDLSAAVHAWVGGHMGSVTTAAADPVFWLHQCNVDRIWAEWQRTWGASSYLPSVSGRSGHNVNDRLPPWDDTTPQSVLGPLPYEYDRFYAITKLVVVIKTSDAFFSGTDDPISLTLFGPSAAVALDLDGAHCDHKDPFETGQTDTFTFTEIRDRVTGAPIAPESLTYFTLRKGSTTRTGDWRVARIRIQAEGTVLYDNRSLDVKLVQSEARFTDNLIAASA